MGFTPRAHQPNCESFVPSLEERKARLQEAWKAANEAMMHPQLLWKKQPNFRLYCKGDKVWLEGTNLHTSHPTPKLRLKWFGLFKIMEELSPVTYKLVLLVKWKLHNAFHVVVLSPYWKMSIHGINYPSPTPELIHREPEWEIEIILASCHHRHKRDLQYLVKWVRYPEADNLWKLVKNVHALKLRNDFHKRFPYATWGIKLTNALGKKRASPD